MPAGAKSSADAQLLGNLAKVSHGAGPTNITHYNIKPTIDVQMSVQGTDLGSVSSAVRDIKSNSSRWLCTTFPELGSFAWQTGYGAFAVSWSLRDEVRRYIENQETHHQTRSFTDELREWFEKHGMVLDDRFLD